MSVCGYKQTFWPVGDQVRFTPETGLSDLEIGPG
jgi:hypothetical protein